MPPTAPLPPRPDPEDEPEEWRDRTYADADLANRMLRGGELQRCSFSRCRMTGFQVPEGALADVHFVECRVDLAALRYATLTRVRFERCDLRELDLTEARLQDVLFEGCNLQLAEFGGARSSRLELRDCEVDGLGGIDGLRGAVVSWPDAMGLLGSFVAAAGLVVREPEE
ncbi:MAG: pentapeptide repeat protein [Solirubrobacterales bacterium]|jgi:uncharacterized protein YjbI with pentapeptide repeats|nr:pentapeptide repeat protein [Solirubrobacterales bacterium]